MKVGSLVECVRKMNIEDYGEEIKWLPKTNTPYVVRSIEESYYNKRDLLVCLEEGIIGYGREGSHIVEIGMPIHYFRELQPPMDLSELLKESLCAPSQHIN